MTRVHDPILQHKLFLFRRSAPIPTTVISPVHHVCHSCFTSSPQSLHPIGEILNQFDLGALASLDSLVFGGARLSPTVLVLLGQEHFVHDVVVFALLLL